MPSATLTIILYKFGPPPEILVFITCPAMKVQVSQRKCTDSPEPLLHAYANYGCRWRLRPKVRSLTFGGLIDGIGKFKGELRDILKKCFYPNLIVQAHLYILLKTFFEPFSRNIWHTNLLSQVYADLTPNKAQVWKSTTNCKIICGPQDNIRG